MNRCGVQQNAFAACEEMRSPFGSIMSDRKDHLFCPKPRRLGHISGADHIKPLRWHPGQQAEPCDSKAGAEILDIILTKGGYGGFDQQSSGQVASSPPYFCGSPPSRSANPLVLDARFGEEKPTPLTPLPVPTVSAMSPSSAGARKGCVRTKFGPKPAAVRIEGFDCLDRDNRGSHSIPAVA